MFTHQAAPLHPLGLSVGATNLAGAGDVHPAVVLPSEVTLQGQRMTGFVERIGDPVPLVAPDGSNHRPEHLLADALHTVAQRATRGSDVAEVAVAVPAHWQPSVVDTLRRTVQHEVVSDATAALTALSADPGLPRHGVVVLCDFGGSGTSITLADAAADHAVIGDTVRFADFSGDLVDQALLRHVAASFADFGIDPSGTLMVGSLSRLRAECRGAKERLSGDTATTIVVDLPGHRTDFRITRAELEGLMHGSVTDFLAVLDDTLQRQHVAPAAVSAVATVGGGARIPLLTQLLSEHLRVPVVTTPHPALTAAHGAALIARRSAVVETATALAPAAGADAMTATVATGAPSSTFGALAWSQDDGFGADVLFASADTDYQPASSRPELHFQQEQWQDSAPPRRAPLVLFGLAAAAAVITTAVFGVMQLSSDTATPVEAATTVAPSSAPAAPVNTPAPPAPQAPLVTTVVVQPAQRSGPVPRQQAPAPRPVAPPVAAPPPAAPPPSAPPTTTPPSTTPPTTPPSTPPSTPPEPPPIDPPDTPPSSPEPPPIDPGPGNGEDPGTPPADPGDLPPGQPETDGGS
ncbi:Hsp70 family protein [Mycobacterium sp. B14F4]|uniref:Hsp70 family protein n=1 Tax=Mycobacterium sp. B14F4 TaxID=3153565 RepID=UPI00325C3E43